jgi:hypothetical protein
VGRDSISRFSGCKAAVSTVSRGLERAWSSATLSFHSRSRTHAGTLGSQIFLNRAEPCSSITMRSRKHVFPGTKAIAPSIFIIELRTSEQNQSQLGVADWELLCEYHPAPKLPRDQNPQDQ